LVEKGDGSIFAPVEQLDSVKAKIEERGGATFSERNNKGTLPIFLLGTVLRLGAVYGSRIKGNYERLTQALARNRFIPIGNGLNRRTLVYDKDVARVAVLVAEHPDAAGRIYNVSDGGFHTLNEIVAAICAGLGRKPPRFSVPIGPARFMVGLMEDAFRLVGRKSPIGRDTIDKYTEDIAVSSQLIQEELGFVPKFGLKTG
jgi:UDP-glucose 4-epimerase